MALIGFDRDAEIEFLPEFMGNRASDDPCIITMKFVSYEKVLNYSKQINRKLDAQTKGFRDITSKKNDIELEIQKKQFTENVVKIENYFVMRKDDSGKEQKVAITSPDEFYELAPSGIIYEIIRAMEDNEKLSDGQVKN